MTFPNTPLKRKWSLGSSDSHSDTNDFIMSRTKKPTYETPEVEDMTEVNSFSCSARENETLNLKNEDDASYSTSISSPINENSDIAGDGLTSHTSVNILSKPDIDGDRTTGSDTSPTAINFFRSEDASEANSSSKWQFSPPVPCWSPQTELSIDRQMSVGEKQILRRESVSRNVQNLLGGEGVNFQFNYVANGCATWQDKLTSYFRNLVARHSCGRQTPTGRDEEDREKLLCLWAKTVDLQFPFKTNGSSTWQCNPAGHGLNQQAGLSFERPTINGHDEILYIEKKNGNRQELFCLGFPNLEETCYMNATLQALLSLTPFVQEMCNQRKVWHYCPTSEIMRWFMKVKNCHSSNNRTKKKFVLAAFKMIVAAFNTEFEDGTQKDAHEFLTCVLDIMKSHASRLQKAAHFMDLRYTCPVNTHITFQIMSIRTCTGCGVKSFKNEDYINLALDLVPGGSVQDCLEAYLKESELDYKCDCGAEKSTLCSSFLNLPNVLIFQLKRFTFTTSNTGIKLKQPVQILQELEVNPDYCGLNVEPTLYSLVCIISHLGSTPDSGHYICDVAQRDASGALTDDWLIFSDINVWQVTRDSVCQGRTRTAYLLFYEKNL